MPGKTPRTKKLSSVVPVTVLGIDSSWEPATRAARDYRDKHVYPYFEKLGFRVTKSQGSLARRYYAAPEAKKPEVEYITGVGHGLYNLYTGDQSDAVFRVGDYQAEEVNGKIIHLLSCQTARDLGPDFVSKGAKAFFGYDENFVFTMAEKDTYFECDSEIDLAFADGSSAGQVFERVKALFEKRIAEFRAEGKLDVAATLQFNLNHLRSPADGERWGDTKARLG